MKKQNSITVLRCKKCNSHVWSRHTHDFRWCKCHSVAIDGGRDYCKLTGNPENIETYKIIIPKNVSKLYSGLYESLEDFRNSDPYTLKEGLADIFIRVCDLASVINPEDFKKAFELMFEVMAEQLYIKIKIDEKRRYRHGNKRR